ncbi:MAG: DUF1592 domain-containing protein [Verrucomicrobiota bacterium]|nr:DUF1592 domain-containing protein [Verrucomicrobiota bacterium]
MSLSILLIFSLTCLGVAVTGASERAMFTGFEKTLKPLLLKYCIDCHGGKKVKGEVDFTKIKSGKDVADAFELWEKVSEVIRHKDMPPEDEEQPTDAQRGLIQQWYEKDFIARVEPRPGLFKPRRLSAVEFENTLASLLGFKMEVTVAHAEESEIESSLIEKIFPPDPPGGNRFKNDTHSTPLSLAQWEKYGQIVDAGIAELFSQSRRAQLEVYTGSIQDTLDLDHARGLLKGFLPRAYRRPVGQPVMEVAVKNVKEAKDLEQALRFEMKVALMSPQFLYRGFLMQPQKDGPQAVDPYELAERLSYFIWADMPDALLMEAAIGGLQKKARIHEQVTRMLTSPKARMLAEVFANEWLTLGEIDKVTGRNPVHKKGITDQPLEFMHYLFSENRPLLELIDSRVTFANPQMRRFYEREDHAKIKNVARASGIERAYVPLQRITLADSRVRGGILTMPGILMMNKGPVTRGHWMLERIMGVHLPDPPDDIKPVPNNKNGQKLSFRERFALHRDNASCAVCHDRIDPLGFALDAYRSNGDFIRNNQDPVDTSGQLPSGESFKDFAGLKEILLTSQRRVIIRNIVERMLSYGVARKLTVYDRATIERITNEMEQTNGGYGDLIRMISVSMPFTMTIKEKAS